MSAEKPLWTPGNYADGDGQFRRPESRFRDAVSTDPNGLFPAEAGRYVLYVNYGCPWAHRTIIVRALKGLEDVIDLIEAAGKTEGKGWTFTGPPGRDTDPLYGFKYVRELYEKADPQYKGIISVPVLWDKRKETIVNNESSEIIRMLYNAFDAFLPEDRREATKDKAGLFPQHLRREIEDMNDWVYNSVNNGVYKAGFASTQEAYEGHVYPLFKSLDRLEEHLADPSQPYLFGENITEADIRLFTTLIRFDVAYYSIFKCNLKMIRYDYPCLHQWLRRLYWDESDRTRGAFHRTIRFSAYKEGYTQAVGGKIVSVGPLPDILPL